MATATATWSEPTQREDGEPFDPATELRESELLMSADGGTTWTDPATVPQGTTSFRVENLAPGTYTFRHVFIDTDGRRSGEATDTGKVTAPPAAAADFTVTITE